MPRRKLPNIFVVSVLVHRTVGATLEVSTALWFSRCTDEAMARKKAIAATSTVPGWTVVEAKVVEIPEGF